MDKQEKDKNEKNVKTHSEKLRKNWENIEKQGNTLKKQRNIWKNQNKSRNSREIMRK